MDGYLKRRLSNPAYGSGVTDESSAYKRFAFERLVEEQKPTDAHPLQMVRHEASASKKLYRATDNAKQGPCWDGYRKVEGMADYADGSCVKVGKKKKKKSGEKKKKKKKEKKEGDKSSSSSDSDSDHEHKKKSKD